MQPDQIAHYLAEMSRLSREVLYLKQWLEFVKYADQIVVSRDTYRLPPEWRIRHDAADPIQDRFFELVAERVPVLR